MFDIPQKTAPVYTATSMPVLLADFKTHARIVTTTEDSLITSFLIAATVRAERHMNRSLGDQQWTLYLDGFPYTRANNGVILPAAIRLFYPPVVSIDAVKYTDQSQVVQTMVSGTDYTADLDALPPRLVPAYNQQWPATLDYIKTVQIDYTAGYMHGGGSVPQPIQQAIRLMASVWYENREALTDRPLSEMPLPFGATALLDQYKVWRF